MTHDELLAKLVPIIDPDDPRDFITSEDIFKQRDALAAVVELHKPSFYEGKEDEAWCPQCADQRSYAKYPCPTIQAIEKELK